MREVAVAVTLSEQRIDGERIYSGKILDLEVDRVKLPNGHVTIREVVRHPGAVVVVPVLSGDRLVLVRQYRYPVGKVLLELPAGKLDPGEEPSTCARRELGEEIGMSARRWTPLGSLYTTPGFSDEVLHVFLATDLQPQAGLGPDDDEFLEVSIMPKSEAFALARGGKIHDAKTLAGLFLWQLAARHE
jgi:ADP-ribose pyrophosphatase